MCDAALDGDREEFLHDLRRCPNRMHAVLLLDVALDPDFFDGWHALGMALLKTGHTNAAGYCLVASSKRGNMRLISVVMGTNSMQARADQTRALFSWGFANYDSAVLQNAGGVLATPKVWFGKSDLVKAGIASDLAVTLPRGQRDQVKMEMVSNAEVEAPIAKGQELGTLNAVLDGKVIASTPLVAMEAVEEANVFVRIWHSIKRFFSNLF